MECLTFNVCGLRTPTLQSLRAVTLKRPSAKRVQTAVGGPRSSFVRKDSQNVGVGRATAESRSKPTDPLADNSDPDYDDCEQWAETPILPRHPYSRANTGCAPLIISSAMPLQQRPSAVPYHRSTTDIIQLHQQKQAAIQKGALRRSDVENKPSADDNDVGIQKRTRQHCRLMCSIDSSIGSDEVIVDCWTGNHTNANVGPRRPGLQANWAHDDIANSKANVHRVVKTQQGSRRIHMKKRPPLPDALRKAQRVFQAVFDSGSSYGRGLYWTKSSRNSKSR